MNEISHYLSLDFIKVGYENLLFGIIDGKETLPHKSLSLFELTHFIEIFALGMLVQPKATMVGFTASIIENLSLSAVEKIFNVAVNSNIPKNNSLQSLDKQLELIHEMRSKLEVVWIRSGTLVAPLFEEFQYRILIQKSVEWIGDKIFKKMLPKREIKRWSVVIGPQGVTIKGIKINVPKIIAIINIINVVCI